ncbi:MAG: ribonuclease E/G [Clostridiales bacterium]|nr:ribonuclease E/G [Clostridiales bacterium]
MNQYIICKMRVNIFSFLLNEGKAVEIHCDREKEASILGNIYIGRIRDIVKNIGAAFVQIDPETVCYLPLSDVVNPVYTKKGASEKPQSGDELLVQVSRDAIKSKYPSVTTNLTLHGKYILLTTGNRRISASSRLEKTEKKRLINLVRELETSICENMENTSRPFGWLLRTNSHDTDENTIKNDMQRLYVQYQTLLQSAPHRVCFSCLLSSPSPWISRMSDLYEASAGQFLTDDEIIWSEAREYLAFHQPDDLSKLSLYQDSLLPLFKKYSLESQLQEALSEHVWLRSGGYLVIQPTEALTVIDVNTGKFEGGGKDPQKAFYKINLEAAAEAARQIRLRNLSGIILIDFINMDSPESNKELLLFLEGLLQKDPIKTVLVDMTALSLVEITRMKKEKPLHEQVKQQQ